MTPSSEWGDRDGLVLDLPEDEYHGGPEFSSSAAKEILRSPAHYKDVYIDGYRPTKKAWDIGTAAHAKVLGTGPETVLIPEEMLSATGSTNTGAAQKFMAEARAAKKTPVKKAEFEAINRMAENVLAHTSARLVLEQDHHAEASMFATDPETGLRTRCRFDLLTASFRYAGDLKTIDDASWNAVNYSVKKWKYHLQREFYDDIATWLGYELEGFPFIFVEKVRPHGVAVYEFDRDLREMGKTEAAATRRKLLECRERDEWPAYPPEIQLLKPSVGHINDFQDKYETEF